MRIIVFTLTKGILTLDNVSTVEFNRMPGEFIFHVFGEGTIDPISDEEVISIHIVK